MNSIVQNFKDNQAGILAVVAIEIIIGLGSYLFIPTILD